MPQLKKVVLAMGDRLIYRDTFDEALSRSDGCTDACGGCACSSRNFRGEREKCAFTGRAASETSGPG